MSLSRAGKKRIGQAAMLEGRFLEERVPFQAFATLTFARKVSSLLLNGVLTRWITEVQKHNRLTLGWLVAVEPQPCRHVHILLAAGGALDCLHAEGLWRKLVAPRYLDAARVEPYVKGIGGAAYVLKTLDRDYEDVRLSDNLPAFYPGVSTTFYGETPPQRRQIRRIQNQCLSARQR